MFGEDCIVQCQLPLAIADDSEPEPDVAVVEGEIADYRDAHPSAALLVVEVADDSLRRDRSRVVTASTVSQMSATLASD